jgi:hypothetical protein
MIAKASSFSTSSTLTSSITHRNKNIGQNKNERSSLSSSKSSSSTKKGAKILVSKSTLTTTKRNKRTQTRANTNMNTNNIITEISAGGGGIPGIDTTAFDQLFIDVASFILPAWGIIVGTIFVFGTIAKVAFPEKYDEMTTKAEKEAIKSKIDLDNLSEDDLLAVAELEAELKAKGKM